MPELPDVEIFRNYFSATSLHTPIEAVDVDAPEMLRGVSASRLQSTLRGASFQSAHRHGKYLFALPESGQCLVLHFGMTGFLKYFKNEESSPGHERLLIDFAGGFRLAYVSQRKLGEVALAGDIESFLAGCRLGPDALAECGEPEVLADILSGSRASVKSALMNQENLAGIGNIYSDEILFQAGIHPKSRSSRIGADGVRALHGAMKKVLSKAIECKAEPARMPRTYLLPRRGSDSSCPRCGGGIRAEKLSGRTAYYCPSCQKKV